MQVYVLRLLPVLCFLLSAPKPLLGQPVSDTLRLDVMAAIRHALEVSPEVDAVAAELDYARARSSLARASRFATEFNLQTAHSIAPGLKNLPECASTGECEDRLYLFPDVRNDWENPHPLNRFEIDLVQPLFTWGQLTGNIRAARFGVEVEEAAVDEKQIEVALRTGELYFGLLLAEALSRLTGEAGDIVERAKVEIRRLLDEGTEDVDDADLFQVLITEQEFQSRVIEVTQQLQTVRSALERQLFLPDESVVEPVEAVLDPLVFVLDSLEAYQRLALANRPELARAAAGLKAREAQVTVARSDFFPKLFLGAQSRITLAEGRFRQPSPYISDDYRGRSILAGLGLRLPLTFGQTRAKVEQAEAQRNEVRHQLRAARQLVLFEVEEAYRNLITARGAMEAQEEALRISREWLRTEQINFDLDLGDTENLVRAVQSSLELEASYYDRVRRYNVAVLRLLAATGTLVGRAETGTLVD